MVQGTCKSKQSTSFSFSDKQISSKPKFSFWLWLSNCWAYQNNKPQEFPLTNKTYKYPQSYTQKLSSNQFDFLALYYYFDFDEILLLKADFKCKIKTTYHLIILLES